MSRLINLYTDDGRVVVGRTAAPFPISVNVGFALVGPIITGYTPVVTTTTVITRRPGRRPIITTRTVTTYRPVSVFPLYPMFYGGVY